MTVISLHKPCRNFHLGIHYTLNGVSSVNNNNYYYYSLKIFSISDWLKPHALFLRFWLAKTSRIIHHNQLLSTKIWSIFNMEEICNMWKITSKVQWNCQIVEPLTEKTCGRGWVVLVVTSKWQDISLVSRVRNMQTIGYKHSKNSTKTTQWTTSAIWRIFAHLNDPLSPKVQVYGSINCC